MSVPIIVCYFKDAKGKSRDMPFIEITGWNDQDKQKSARNAVLGEYPGATIERFTYPRRMLADQPVPEPHVAPLILSPDETATEVKVKP